MTSFQDPHPIEPRTATRLLHHFAVWCVVCWIAAAPSFYFGMIIGDMITPQISAMALGVFLFAGAYAWVSTSAWFQRLRRRPFVNRTLKIGYGLRLAQSFLSIIPPLIIADMFLGVLSLALAGAMFGEFTLGSDPGAPPIPPVVVFVRHLVATLIQGCLLNIVLIVLMLVIQGIQRMFCTPPGVFRGLCLKCNYDLRASKEVCPECGEPIPVDPSPAGPSPDSPVQQINRP